MLPKKTNLSVIIPICNEEEILEYQVNGLYTNLKKEFDGSFEILLIENGSTDNTLRIAQGLQGKYPEIKTLSIPPANYGMAVREGMINASGEYIAHFDIDYWDIRFLKMCLALIPFDYDVIIGSKNLFLSLDGRHFFRRFVSQVFRIFLHLLFHLKVSDTHGIKFWRNTENLRHIIANCRRSIHMFDTEIIIRAQYENLKLLELPVELQEIRKSSLSIIKRIPIAIYEMILIWLSIIRGKNKPTQK